MPKRLGYETTACMMLIRREINKHMINEKINKSKLVNDLLLKWYDGTLCPKCLGGAIRTRHCQRCEAEWIACRNQGCKVQTKTCECTWDEVDGD